MNANTMDEQFLSKLCPQQQGIVWEYYRLISKGDELVESDLERISDIWEVAAAAQDDRLFKWLEFIDYLYTNVEDIDLPNEAKRAFLSEYLPAEVIEEGTETGVDQRRADGTYIVRVLRCPEDMGEVVVAWNEKEQGAIDSPCFANHVCSHCHRKYAEHTPVKRTVIIPKP